MQKLGRMSVTDTLFGRWGLAVADDVTLEKEAIFVRRLAILISMPHDSKILFMKDLSRCNFFSK
jgi:hypothetical protein